MAEASDQLGVGVEVEGAEAAARDLSRLERSIKQVDQTQAASARGTMAADRAAKAHAAELKKMSRQYASTTSVLATFSAQTASAIPQVSGLSGTLMAAGTNASSFASLLGPMGIAVGVLSAAMPSLIRYVRELAGANEEAANATDKATKSLDDFIAKAKTAQAEAARSQALRMGVADADTAAGAYEQAKDKLLEMRKELNEVAESAGVHSTVMFENGRTAGGVAAQVAKLSGEYRGNQEAIDGLARKILEYRQQVRLTTNAEIEAAKAARERAEGQSEAEEEADIAAAQAKRRAEDEKSQADAARAADKRRAEAKRELIEAIGEETEAVILAIRANDEYSLPVFHAFQERLNALREKGADVAKAVARAEEQLAGAFQKQEEASRRAREESRRRVDQMVKELEAEEKLANAERKTRESAAVDSAFAQQRLDTKPFEERNSQIEKEIELTQRLIDSGEYLTQQDELRVRLAEKQHELMMSQAQTMKSDLQPNIDNMVGSLQQSVGLMIEEGASFKDAMKEGLQAFLQKFAMEQAFKGGEALAEGIATAVSNPPNAAAKFAGAAKHFALAGAAGGGAAVVGAAGGGGGAPTATASPQQPERQRGGNVGPPTIINFNAPTSEEEMGRQFARAQRAASRRFGEAA